MSNRLQALKTAKFLDCVILETSLSKVRLRLAKIITSGPPLKAVQNRHAPAEESDIAPCPLAHTGYQ